MSEPRACPDCLRRSRLLAHLAPYIERYVSGAPGKNLTELLRLGNEDLAATVAPEVATQVLAQIAALSEKRLQDKVDAAECWGCCRHDPRFPTGLRRLADAPWALIGRGNPALLSQLSPRSAVAIAGARRASIYGREVARGLGHDLARAGLVVVSGLAFGIDACAHRGALDAGATVAVLGCGADVAYPAAHRSLWRRISERGLVLSELPPGTNAWRWTFPARSRIVAGLCGMTVVVEAAERSGALLTAELAAECGHEVGAVPGPVGSRLSIAPNNLLADGARLVRGGQDVLDAMFADGARRVERLGPPLDVTQWEVLRALEEGAQTPEEVATDTGRSEQEAEDALGALEALGYAERSPVAAYVSTGLEAPSAV